MSGNACIIIPEFDNFNALSIKEGYCFGEIELIFKKDTRLYSIMAETDLELLVLNKENFEEIFFSEFREMGLRLYKQAYYRSIRRKQIYNKAKKYWLKKFNRNPIKFFKKKVATLDFYILLIL